jgi:hypothetical protein
VGTLIRWLLLLLLTLLGMVFMLCLFAALGIYLVYSLIRWLLTGRKPQFAMVWQQYRGMRQRFKSDAGSEQGDVIDVEVREVRDDRLSRDKAPK